MPLRASACGARGGAAYYPFVSLATISWCRYLPHDHNPGMSDILSTLAELDREELAVSARRRSLHEQIDQLYLSSPLDKEQITKLELLENQARGVSSRRQTLHRKINGLRAQAGQQAFRRQDEPPPTLRP